MKKHRFLLITAIAAVISVFSYSFFRTVPLDERITYPFDTRHQAQAFIDRILSTNPPESLAPPQERTEWEEASRFYRREIAQALDIEMFPNRPLNEHLNKTSPHERYQVTPVSFDTLPDIRASGAFYLPKTAAPFLSILLASGEESITSTPVRRIAATLASSGVAVLTLEPPGRGSRKMNGKGDETFFLTGFTPLAALVFEQQQALSFLRKRPETAAIPIVIVGVGSSADATVYATALDETVAGLAAFGVRTPFQTASAAEDLSNIPLLSHRSFAVHHLFGLIAPRPFLLSFSATDRDYPVPLKEITRRTEEFYRFLGKDTLFFPSDSRKEERLSLSCRQSIYAFLSEQFSLTPIEEEENDLPSSTELSEDPRHRDGISLAELGRREALIFRDMIRSRRDEIGPERYAQEITEEIRDLAGAGLWGAAPPLDPIIHRSEHEGEIFTEVLSFASDPGVRVPSLLSVPPRATNAVIVVSETSLAQRIAEDLSAEGTIVLEIALRRMEEGTFLDRFLRPIGGRHGAIAALVSGLPAAAQQSTDILAAATYLGERFGLESPVGLYAEGPTATIAALLAAHRSDRIGWLVLNGIPVSLVPSERGNNALIRELALRVPGILRYGDIADLIATLAPRRTLVTGLLGPARQAENEATFFNLLWEKRHVLILSRPDRAIITRFLRTRGTTPAP